MRASRLLQILQRLGVTFRVEKQKLVAGRMRTASVRAVVKQHKKVLTDALRGKDSFIDSLEDQPLVIEYLPGKNFVSLPRGYRGDVAGRLRLEAERRVLDEYIETRPRRELDRRWKDELRDRQRFSTRRFL